MYVEVAWQARTGASSEVHPDIKAVRRYRQRQGLLRFAHQLYQLQHLFIACRFEVGNVTEGGYQQMAVVVWEAIQYYDAFGRAPEHEIFVIVLRGLLDIADKAIAALIQGLDIFNSPRRP